MFTSRAEHRLLLRQDNALFRLLPHAHELGVLPPEALRDIATMAKALDQELARLAATFDQGVSLSQWLRRPEVTYETMPKALLDLDPIVKEQVEVMTKYEGYIQRDLERIAKAEVLERKRIPKDFDYAPILALRRESREKLQAIRPETLGQASRISGVNPSDIAILEVWLKRVNA